jgi:D-alanyl-D-alanine carboxypeptidase
MDRDMPFDELAERGVGITRRQILGAGAVGFTAVAAGSPLGVATGAPASAVSPGFEGFDRRTRLALDSILVSGMGAAQIPGLEVGIWVPGRGRLVEALGRSDSVTGAPLTVLDHFRIASVTKSFIATVVLRLFDQGRIHLDDTLSKFISGVANGEQITMAELLNMTSGIYDYVNDQALTEQETANPLLRFSLRDVLAIIARNAPVFAPGSQVMYDNSNYYLLGAVIEQVTGHPLPHVVKQQVLDPLGLTQTSYPTTAEIPGPYSRGYFYRPNFGLRDVTASNPAFAGGAGAMISTLADLKVWAHALATGTLLKPATQALRLRTRALVTTPKVTLGYGMGITNINGFLGHDGAIVGYGSLVLYLPRRRATIVLLGNSNDNANPNPLPIGLAVAAYLFPEQFPNGI